MLFASFVDPLCCVTSLVDFISWLLLHSLWWLSRHSTVICFTLLETSGTPCLQLWC